MALFGLFGKKKTKRGTRQRGSRSGGGSPRRDPAAPTRPVNISEAPQPGFAVPQPAGNATEMSPTPPPMPAAPAQPAPMPAAPQAQPVAHTPPPSDAGDDRTTLVAVGAAPSSGVVGVLIAQAGGELANEVFRVLDGINVIGRPKKGEPPPANKVILDSRYVSREHAEIEHRDGIFVLRARADENPVFVNGDQVGDAILDDGDLIKLGQTTLKLRFA